MVEPELSITIDSASTRDPEPVLRVVGEVDIQTSPILDQHLQRVHAEGASSVVVDLSGVTFLDSTGLSVLITGLQRCQDSGGTMRLQSPRPGVRKVFEITGLVELFGIGAPDADTSPS